MTTPKTISDITKAVVSQDLVQIAQEKFKKDFNKKGGVQTQSLNLDLKNATLKKIDYTQTEELKDLGVINNLEIPTENGRIVYTFNEKEHSISIFANADEKKEMLFNKLKNNKDFNSITEYIIENNGALDNSSLQATHYTQESSDSDEKLEQDTLAVLIRDINSTEVIGQVAYNGTHDDFTLYLGEDKVVVSDGELEVTPSATCLLSWMKCIMDCMCGGKETCMIGIPTCVASCCGCPAEGISCSVCAACGASFVSCANGKCNTGGK